MPKAFYLTQAVVAGMLGSTGLTEAIDAGTGAVIEIRSGTVPSNADAPETGTLLASLPCSSPAFSGITDTGTAARATFGAITDDSSADNTGTASYFRIKDQSGGTTIGQGTVGTTDSDLVLNTTAITAGSTISISSAVIDLPEGP